MKKIHIISLILLVPCIYINFLVYKSHIIQNVLLKEFNTQDYTEQTTAYFNNFNTDFPNLSVTAIPLKSMIARYYFFAGQTEKAFSLIEQGSKANPYLKFHSSLKADIYDNLMVKDSFLYYSKDAFYSMPNNAKHFVQYIKALSLDNNYSEMLNAYKLVSKRDNYQFARAILVGLLKTGKNNDSIRDFARSLRVKYIDNEEVRLAADYLNFGEKNIKKSIEYSDIAKKYYEEGKVMEAKFAYIEASKLNPNDYTNFENAGLAMYQLGEVEPSIDYFKLVIEDKIRAKKGKSELLLGMAYIKIGKQDLGCKYLIKSQQLDFPNAYRFVAENCNSKK